MNILTSVLLALGLSATGAAGVVGVISTLGNGHGHGPGGGAPAPEIGAGMLGLLLAAGAVKYFRGRTRT
jgi:hypothetical protein